MPLTVPPESQGAASTDEPYIRLPMWRLSALLLGVVKAVVISAALLAGLEGGRGTVSRVAADGWATAILYAATGAGLGLLWLLPPRPARKWVKPAVAASALRILLVAGLGVGIYLHVHPHRQFFWTVLIVASIAVTAVEALLVRRLLRTPASLRKTLVGTQPGSRAA